MFFTARGRCHLTVFILCRGYLLSGTLANNKEPESASSALSAKIKITLNDNGPMKWVSPYLFYQHARETHKNWKDSVVNVIRFYAISWKLHAYVTFSHNLH